MTARRSSGAASVDAAARDDAGSTAAVFTDAYRALAAPVLAYLRSQGVEDPEAVTQDVFVALYPRLDTLTGGGDGLRTLVFSIAHARVVDHHRRRARAPEPVEYDPRTDSRSAPSAEDDVVGGATGVGQLIERLAPEYRDVIALRILAELTIDEVAQLLGRSPGAVKQLQRRALIALRRELAVEAEVTR
ncbi:RNA polymerase sigma factor [Leifsonia shinshuensis]|uniref:RNA polymerase sigma factor n=1 Tax=Leifsonia shinshuensis TaxID=150026 RepID=UPI001F50F3EB|nr:sigma-70 family RNA polymerase sigma factor [Leifsonia shinshuensis]